MEELRDRMREFLRDNRLMSATAVAQEVGIHHRTMMSFLRSGRNPSRGTVATIKKFLDSK